LTGDAWTLVGSATINMASQAYVGVAVTNHDAGELATAPFSSLTVQSSTTTPPALPSPWMGTDVGNPALPGRSGESSGTFTVTGAGEEIWNESASFQFVYRPVTGDAEIVALVASLQGEHEWSKAGVMMRTDLTGPARARVHDGDERKWWAFQRRLVAGGSSYHTAGPGGVAPGWVRLVRVGGPFTTTPSNVAAGSYTLSATATDNEGATTTSPQVVVRVGFDPTRPIVILLGPSPDNDTNVSSYTVELRREGDVVTSAPVASKNVGNRLSSTVR
jgi:hypothetical protein